MTTHLEQLEQETEQARAELSGTLHDLQSRMSPGQMLDDAIDYFHDGDVAALASNLRRQAVENPIALALFGIGLAWLMRTRKNTVFAQKSDSRRLRQVKDTAVEAGERIGSGTQAIAEKAQSVSSRIADAGRKVAGAASSTGETISRGYGQFKATSAEVQHEIADAAMRQPLLLVAVGLAIGAGIEASSRKDAHRL
jgi:hypothetical protein